MQRSKPKVVRVQVRATGSGQAVEIFQHALQAAARRVSIKAREKVVPEDSFDSNGPVGDDRYTVEFYFPLDGEGTGTSIARRATDVEVEVIEFEER